MSSAEQRTASVLRWGVSGINYRRARSRALTKLSNKYKAEYLELLEEEKARDVAEGKNWTTISGSPISNLGSSSHIAQPNRETTASDTGDN